MLFIFNSAKVRNIYWKIFFIMSAVCFVSYQLGITYFICDLIGASTDDTDLITTSMLFPICYLIFNFFVIWILELIYD